MKEAQEAKEKAQQEKAAKEKAEAERQAAEKAKKEAEEKKKKEEAAKAAKEKKIAAEKAKRQAVFDKMSAVFNKELDSFSVTLSKKHFDQALAAREKIKDAGFEEPAMSVHTMDIYKKSFTFPQIAHNDYAVEQFDALSIAEQNLN